MLKIILRIYNYYFSPEKHFVRRLRSLLGFTPANVRVFKLAFYHKSATTEKLYAVQSNERLEYLGDALLGTIVAEYLFKKYPNRDEGFLTKMRSKIVKRNSLNTIADKMGLDVFLNEYNRTRLSRSMLGNSLEALVGAVYLEKGYPATKKFVIKRLLRNYLDIHELEAYDDNYKSQLLEHCQKNGQAVEYKMLAKYKYEKRDRFKVAVLIDGEKLASADDFNKKSAEQIASEKTLISLGLIQSKKKSGGKKRSSKNKPPRVSPMPKSKRENGSKSTSRSKSAKSDTNTKKRQGPRDNQNPKSGKGSPKQDGGPNRQINGKAKKTRGKQTANSAGGNKDVPTGKKLNTVEKNSEIVPEISKIAPVRSTKSIKPIAQGGPSKKSTPTPHKKTRTSNKEVMGHSFMAISEEE